MIKNLCVGLIFGFLFLGTQAQEILFMDKRTSDVVSGVQVDIVGKRRMSQFSNSEGRLVLEGCESTDTILVSHVTYNQIKVSVSTLDRPVNKVYLEIGAIAYPGVIIIPNAREKAISSPQQVKVLDLKEIQKYAPANAASLLESTGQVMVQRSQQGGGSPIIRGFEANRVLLVVDGVRMNNAIYRSGHLQNAITVDNNILESTEVIFGTSSLIYGSDALGGVVHYHSLDPSFSDSSYFKVNTSLKYATAAQENSAHAHFQYLSKNFTSLTSFSYSDFGDLKMGANRNHGDSTWGLVPEYVEIVDGVDQVRQSADANVQRHSAYHQYDLAQKIKLKISDRTELRLNGQYSTTSDIPRFDQYNDYRNGTLRYAEWYYGPQSRVLVSVGAEIRPEAKWFDKVSIIAAFQKIDEDRITRNFGSDTRFTREEDVNVYSLNTDFVKGFSDDKKLFYGIEVTSNDVVSNAFIKNINTNEVVPGLTRYPNGGSTFNTAAIYGSYLNPFAEKWQYNLGLRYNVIESESFFNTNEFFELPFDRVALNNSALTGSAGLKYEHDKNLSLRLLTSSGFRAPNVDDYGKVFDRDGFVVVPDDRLKPEYALNGEVGFNKKFFGQKLQIDVSLYYTQILDAIVQRDFLLNGEDSLSLEGEVSRIQSNQNASEARVYGYGIGLDYAFNPNWKFTSFFNYTFGEVIETKDPLAHIPPFFAKAEIAYEKDAFRAGFYAHYHDIKSPSRIAPGRTDNPNEGLNGYFPSWYTLNLRAGYDITSTISAQVSLDNIMDFHYKAFASGLSAPGRNLTLVLRANIN